MSLSITHISSLGHRGPKATRVNFNINDGLRLWAWVPNAVADGLAAGMQCSGEFTVRPNGQPQTSYTNEAGEVIALKQPSQQVWLNGNLVFDAPNADITAPTFTVTEQASAFATAVRAKAGAPSTTAAENDPF